MARAQASAGSAEPTEAVTGRVFITGGTGFVGGTLRATLAGRPLRLLVRDPAAHGSLASEAVEIVAGDVTKPETLRGAMDGCEAVIHLVAIIAETVGMTFDGVIRQGTQNVVEEAKRAGIKRFLQMSALGARHDPAYPYLEAKWQGEQAVMAMGIPWTIFRPSVIFGPGDEFITTLAKLIRTAPVVPVVGSGRSKFQPVFVNEVAECYVKALDDPKTAGEIYELGGPEILPYEGLLDVVAEKLGKKRPKVHVPVGLMKQVVRLSKPLPKSLRPPVTDEQLKMLALDNCTDHNATARLIGRPPLRLRDGIDYILPGQAR